LIDLACASTSTCNGDSGGGRDTLLCMLVL